MSKLNDNKITNQNDKNEENKKEETLKNEITCIYNKQKDNINLLHEYNEDKKYKYEEGKK